MPRYLDPEIVLRPAEFEDLAQILVMQARSVRAKGPAYYDEAVLEAFIAEVGTMDATLLFDRTYFVAERAGRIVGTAGWSPKTPAYSAHLAGANENGRAVVRVRSVFVDPDETRRGVGRALMARVEREIAAAGHERATLAATLMGVPFYRALGYRGESPVVLDMPGGRTFVGLAMEKTLCSNARLAA